MGHRGAKQDFSVPDQFQQKFQWPAIQLIWVPLQTCLLQSDPLTDGARRMH